MSLRINAEAPNFTAQSLDGEVVTLESFAGRQLVLIFTSPRCSAGCPSPRAGSPRAAAPPPPNGSSRGWRRRREAAERER